MYLSVPALAASASANDDTHGFILGFSWINMCGVSKKPKVMAWKSQYANELELTVSRFRAVSGPMNRSSYVKGNWWVECCFNRRETSEIQAKAYSGQRGTRTRMRSIYTLVYVRSDCI